MAATKRKTVKKSTTTKSGKGASEFYVVRTAQEAVDNVTDKIEEYGSKYVRKPIKAGKTFATDLKKNPKKAVEGVVDDGQEFISGIGKDTRQKLDEVLDGGKRFAKDFNKNPRKAVDGLVDDGKEFFEDLKDETEDRVEDMVSQGREFVGGVEKDIRRLLEDMNDTSRRLIDKITLKETVEKKIKEQMKVMPKQMKLASKRDVQKLAAAVKSLSEKVEELSKKAEPVEDEPIASTPESSE